MPIFNNNISVKNGTTSAGTIRLFENGTNGDNYTDLIGQSTLNSNIILTLPNQTTQIVGSGTTDILSNKSFSDMPIFNSNISVKNGTTSAGTLRLFENGSNGNNYTDLIGPATLASNIILTLPNQTTTLVGLNTADTLSNKNFSGATIFDGSAIFNSTPSTDAGIDIKYSTNGAGFARFYESGTNTGDNFISLKGQENLTANQTITLPDATTTLIGTDTMDTLSNKSFSDTTNFGGTVETEAGIDLRYGSNGAGFARFYESTSNPGNNFVNLKGPDSLDNISPIVTLPSIAGTILVDNNLPSSLAFGTLPEGTVNIGHGGASYSAWSTNLKGYSIVIGEVSSSSEASGKGTGTITLLTDTGNQSNAINIHAKPVYNAGIYSTIDIHSTSRSDASNQAASLINITADDTSQADNISSKIQLTAKTEIGIEADKWGSSRLTVGYADPMSYIYNPNGTNTGGGSATEQRSYIGYHNNGSGLYFNLPAGGTTTNDVFSFLTGGVQKAKIDGAGNMTITGTYSPSPSDQRLKSNIMSFTNNATAILDQIAIKSYNIRKLDNLNHDSQNNLLPFAQRLSTTEEYDIGVIAQDILQIPEIAHIVGNAPANDINPLNIKSWNTLTALLIKSNQELNAKISQLETTVAALSNQGGTS